MIRTTINSKEAVWLRSELGKYLRTFTCTGKLSMTRLLLSKKGYRKKELDEICKGFQLKGGYCDCEVYLNVLHGRPKGMIQQFAKGG